MDATPQAPHEGEPPVSDYTRMKIAIMGYIDRAETHGQGGRERLKGGSRYFPDSAAVDFVLEELRAAKEDKEKISKILSAVYSAIESYPDRSEFGGVVRNAITFELLLDIIKRQVIDMASMAMLLRATESVVREVEDIIEH